MIRPDQKCTPASGSSWIGRLATVCELADVAQLLRLRERHSLDYRPAGRRLRRCICTRPDWVTAISLVQRTRTSALCIDHQTSARRRGSGSRTRPRNSLVAIAVAGLEHASGSKRSRDRSWIGPGALQPGAPPTQPLRGNRQAPPACSGLGRRSALSRQHLIANQRRS